MSEDNNNGNTGQEQSTGASTAKSDNSGGSAVQGLINTLKTNRKAQYAAGAVVAVILLATFMGGGGGQLPQRGQAVVNTGQTVILENPNGGNSHLTQGPGLMSAADAEEDKDQSVCLAKAGTQGKVVEVQMIPVLGGGSLPFVKIEVLDGDCKGKTGWTSKVNIKGG